ncbi:hypothetical protein HNP49_003094 [Pseudomonas fluvialis]|uniref:YcxB-like C-terminal domain-containing protein n=1 Tax=Pseudomonas fluvialis TaxID=1793966 RepID=A0A7X0EVS7_9PSED|nr:YcxB family protein [Pseudomonas fluvialis]MBB6342906.1 hypothetical protein [Pseudomonas fluvialis]
MNPTKITPEEYLSAVKLGQNLTNKQRLKFAALFVVTAIASITSWKLGNITVAGGLFGGAVGCFIGHWIQRLYILKFKAKKIYKQQKFLHESFSYDWSPDGLLVTSDTSSCLTPWSHFVRWRENKDVVLLYHSDCLFQILPKSIFTSQESEQKLRSYIEPVQNA